MIRVNLLPEDRRPVERTPLPRLAIIFIGVLIAALELVGVVYYFLGIPNKKDYLVELEKSAKKWETDAKKVDEMDADIEEFGKRTVVVKQLYKDRRDWAPIFERFREVMPEQVWLRSFKLAKAKGRGAGGVVINIEGSASGQTSRARFEEVRNFMRNIEKDRKLSEEVLFEKEPVGLLKLVQVLLAQDEGDPKRPAWAAEFKLAVKLKPLAGEEPAKKKGRRKK